MLNYKLKNYLLNEIDNEVEQLCENIRENDLHDLSCEELNDVLDNTNTILRKYKQRATKKSNKYLAKFLFLVRETNSILQKSEYSLDVYL